MRRDLRAACSLIAMARLFTDHAEGNFSSAAGKAPLLASFRESRGRAASISKGCSNIVPPHWVTHSQRSWAPSRTVASASVSSVPIHAHPAGRTTDSDRETGKRPLPQPEPFCSCRRWLQNTTRAGESIADPVPRAPPLSTTGARRTASRACRMAPAERRSGHRRAASGSGSDTGVETEFSMRMGVDGSSVDWHSTST